MEKEESQIINKVAASALVTFDLEEYFQAGERVSIDIKDRLFQGLIIKEKDFRDFVKAHDWEQYSQKMVAIHCSADAIIPTWVYMLLAISLQPYARRIVYGTLDDLENSLFMERLAEVNWAQFKNAKVVIKGCSKVNVPTAVYVEATTQLMAHASSLMFGEPCSTVPLFKKRTS